MRASIQNFSMSLTQQYQSIYTIAVGATPLQLGFVNGVGGVAAAAIATPTGWLTGKYGIKKMYLLSTPLMALGALMFALSNSWVWLIPAIFVVSLSTRMMLTACSMVCGSYLTSEERATGMQLCDTISSIPRLIAPMAAALIITWSGGLNRDGIKPLFFVQILSLGAIMMIVLRIFDDPLRGGAARESPGFMEGIRRVMGEGMRMKTWILFISISTLSMFMSSTYLSVFAAEAKGADQFILGGMATASVVAPLSLSLIIGRLADTVGRKKIISLMIPFYILSFILLFYAQNPLWLLASGVLQGFSTLIFITENAMAAELVSMQILGSWFGLLGLFRGLASVAGPLLGGIIWSGLGANHVLFSLMSLEAAKLILLLLFIPETLKSC